MDYKEIKLEGIWKEGYALDTHTISSTYIGDNIYGYPIFENKHSDIGMCVKELKYKDDITKIALLVETSIDFLLNKWKITNEIDLIIPAPPSKPREKQPVFLLAKEIAEKLKKTILFRLF